MIDGHRIVRRWTHRHISLAKLLVLHNEGYDLKRPVLSTKTDELYLEAIFEFSIQLIGPWL
jgi:hypothetical protein